MATNNSALVTVPLQFCAYIVSDVTMSKTREIHKFTL